MGGEKAKEQGPIYGVPYAKLYKKKQENKQNQTNIA